MSNTSLHGTTPGYQFRFTQSFDSHTMSSGITTPSYNRAEQFFEVDEGEESAAAIHHPQQAYYSHQTYCPAESAERAAEETEDGQASSYGSSSSDALGYSTDALAMPGLNSTVAFTGDSTAVLQEAAAAAAAVPAAPSSTRNPRGLSGVGQSQQTSPQVQPSAGALHHGSGGGLNFSPLINRDDSTATVQPGTDLLSDAAASHGVEESAAATGTSSGLSFSSATLSAVLDTALRDAPSNSALRCPSGSHFSVYDADIRQHYIIESSDVAITRGALKYVALNERYGNQTRFRFQLCKRFLQQRCTSGVECSYIHSCVVPKATLVHVNENSITTTGVQQIDQKELSGGKNTMRYATMPTGVVFAIYPPNQTMSPPQLIPSEMILETIGARNTYRALCSGAVPSTTTAATVAAAAVGGGGGGGLRLDGGHLANPNPAAAADATAAIKPRHCAHYQFKRMCNLGTSCNFIHSLIPFVQGMVNQPPLPYPADLTRQSDDGPGFVVSLLPAQMERPLHQAGGAPLAKAGPMLPSNTAMSDTINQPLALQNSALSRAVAHPPLNLMRQMKSNSSRRGAGPAGLIAADPAGAAHHAATHSIVASSSTSTATLSSAAFTMYHGDMQPMLSPYFTGPVAASSPASFLHSYPSATHPMVMQNQWPVMESERRVEPHQQPQRQWSAVPAPPSSSATTAHQTFVGLAPYAAVSGMYGGRVNAVYPSGS